MNEEGTGAATNGAATTTPTVTDPGLASLLPADFEGREQLLNFGSVAELAKGYRELERVMGAKSSMVKPPGETELTPEEQTKWRKACGVPDSVEGYTPPELGDGVELDQGLFQAFAQYAHEAGLGAAQVAGITKFFVDNQAAQQAAQEQEIQAAALKAFGSVEDLALAKSAGERALARVRDAEAREALQGFLGRDVALTRALADLGSMLREDTSPEGKAASIDPRMRQQRVAEIEGWLRDPANSGKAERPAVLEEYSKLLTDIAQQQVGTSG